MEREPVRFSAPASSRLAPSPYAETTALVGPTLARTSAAGAHHDPGPVAVRREVSERWTYSTGSGCSHGRNLHVAALVPHSNRELIHYGAETALRDLYAHRSV